MLLLKVLVIFVLYMYYLIYQQEQLHVIYLNMNDDIYDHMQSVIMMNETILLRFFDMLLRYINSIMLT